MEFFCKTSDTIIRFKNYDAKQRQPTNSFVGCLKKKLVPSNLNRVMYRTYSENRIRGLSVYKHTV